MNPLQRVKYLALWSVFDWADAHIFKCRWWEWCNTEGQLWFSLVEDRAWNNGKWSQLGITRLDWMFPSGWWAYQRIRALAERILLGIVA